MVVRGLVLRWFWAWDARAEAALAMVTTGAAVSPRPAARAGRAARAAKAEPAARPARAAARTAAAARATVARRAWAGAPERAAAPIPTPAAARAARWSCPAGSTRRSSH